LKILALVPYPIEKGPSQRFRLEVFIPYAEKNGFHFDLQPFYSDEAYSLLYKKGKFFQKIFHISQGALRRFFLLWSLSKYDMVYIQREVSPLGPPILAWILKFILRKPYVFDFDDAIWLPNYSSNNASFHKLKMYGKTKYLIKWAHVCSAGNDFLRNYALQFNANTVMLPTVVDTDAYHKERSVDKIENPLPVIGWTGSHSTMKYVEQLFPVFKELEEKYEFQVLIISNRPPAESFRSLKYLPWNKAREIDDLEVIDLGLMPLEDSEQDAFAQGKCGFKIIQYLSLGIPALASDVGVNHLIIEHGINGFLCRNIEDWKLDIESFLQTPERFHEMGIAGRRKILNEYSVRANLDIFQSLFNRT